MSNNNKNFSNNGNDYNKGEITFAHPTIYFV